MKRVGPLKLLPKQCVWCSKNGHQTGAIKSLLAEKKGGGSEIDRGFLTPRSFDSYLEKPLNSIGWQQVPSVRFREFMRFLHRGILFLGNHLLYTTCKRPQNVFI